MTSYQRKDGERFRGAKVFGYLKSGKWTLLSSYEDEGLRVVEDADGEVMVLRVIEGTAESTTGPHIFARD